MTIVQGEIRDLQLDFLLSCSAEIIHRMENYSAIQFSNFRELLMNLFYHLVPAYFRIRFGFYLPNVLIENIQLDYPEIFDFTKQALYPLEQVVGQKFPLKKLVSFPSCLVERLPTRRLKKLRRKSGRSLFVQVGSALL